MKDIISAVSFILFFIWFISVTMDVIYIRKEIEIIKTVLIIRSMEPMNPNGPN